MMMGFDFGDDRRDVWVGLNHGRIHFVMERMPGSLLVIGRRRARLMRRFHGVFVGLEAGIRRESRIVGLVQFRFLRIGQEAHAVMTAGAFTRRRSWRRAGGRRIGGVVRFRE